MSQFCGGSDKPAYSETNSGETLDKPKLRNILKVTGFYFSEVESIKGKGIKDKGGLRNCSRTKKLKRHDN